ncbi:ABC-type transport auxiliary lipoprotein family protein [Acidovorax sp. JHL-9]|uniref:ABC-type transport auxiliary lipoprotein family protein n=1 Tax=Acidovorax sp. JHL-9 TaxID=1276756 RepID=UPI000686B850|nr:ABC-type transport auxiliary lipoprotein family protein [Acidovorax sp. JHL-9]
MKTTKTIATSVCEKSVAAVLAAAFLAGCSALPSPPSRPVHYDFGPGAMAPVPADRRAPLPPLALADLEAPGLVEGSTAVLYRLAYADARQLRPYRQARWSQPPAQLVQQRLRDQLGQRRAVLTAESGAAQARSAGKLPTVLRVELEEFSQVFTSATESAGLVRLRATLAEPAATGETLLGQRVFIVQRPATSADAAGGTRALVEATDQLAQELVQWLEQLGR